MKKKNEMDNLNFPPKQNMQKCSHFPVCPYMTAETDETVQSSRVASKQPISYLLNEAFRDQNLIQELKTLRTHLHLVLTCDLDPDMPFG